MGRNIIHVILCIVLPGFMGIQSAIAQTTPEEPVARVKPFGVRAGFMLSTVAMDSGYWDQNPDLKPGLDLAATVRIPIGGGDFVLQPEIHWLQKGYQIADATADTFAFGKVVNTFNYIELPLLLRYNAGANHKVFVTGGPAAGYFISGTQKSDTYGTQSFDKSTFHRLEWSMYLGAGIVLGAWEVDLRYMQGFNDIADGSADVVNRSFGVGIGFGF